MQCRVLSLRSRFVTPYVCVCCINELQRYAFLFVNSNVNEFSLIMTHSPVTHPFTFDPTDEQMIIIPPNEAKFST